MKKAVTATAREAARPMANVAEAEGREYLSQEEAQAIVDLFQRHLQAYKEKDANVTDQEWLAWLLAKELPQLKVGEAGREAASVIKTILTFATKLQACNEAAGRGRSREGWLAAQIQVGATGRDAREYNRTLALVGQILQAKNLALATALAESKAQHIVLSPGLGEETGCKVTDITSVCQQGLRDNQDNAKAPGSASSLVHSTNLALSLGRAVGVMALQAAAVSTGFDLATRVCQKGHSCEKLVEGALKAGTDAGLKTVIAGTLMVAVERGMVRFMPRRTLVADIACVASERAKILLSVASGGLSVTQGLDRLVRAVISMAACSWVGESEELARQLTAFLAKAGAPCAVVATFAAQMAASCGSSTTGAAVHDAGKKVADAAKLAAKTALKATTAGTKKFDVTMNAVIDRYGIADIVATAKNGWKHREIRYVFNPNQLENFMGTYQGQKLEVEVGNPLLAVYKTIGARHGIKVVERQELRQKAQTMVQTEMLQLQQYLNVHPLLKEERQLRLRYVSLVGYFVKPQRSKDLWVQQLYRLFVQKLAGTDKDVDSAELGDLHWLEEFDFLPYRHFILTDCLFIAAFSKKGLGLAICAQLSTFWGMAYREELANLCEAFYSTAYEGFEEAYPKLQDVYRIIWRNRRFLKQPIRKVMITANMSAGKSTLLNALAGKKVNKTQNDACTAKIHYLYNKAGEDGFIYELDHDLELDASADILMTDNEENKSAEIIVGTYFRSLHEMEWGVWLIDTPGVNSSMDQAHREISQEALQTVNCDILLYLFNGENIGSDDDIRHLHFVKDNYRGKIVFLVNRLDRYKKNADSVPETLAAVRQDLEKIGFAHPEVYPLSAYAAYLAKMSIYGEPLTEDEEDDRELLVHKLKKGEYSFEKYYPVQVDAVGYTDPNAILLLHSGLLSLEQMVYS